MLSLFFVHYCVLSSRSFPWELLSINAFTFLCNMLQSWYTFCISWNILVWSINLNFITQYICIYLSWENAAWRITQTSRSSQFSQKLPLLHPVACHNVAKTQSRRTLSETLFQVHKSLSQPQTTTRRGGRRRSRRRAVIATHPLTPASSSRLWGSGQPHKITSCLNATIGKKRRGH